MQNKIAELLALLKKANNAYRAGEPFLTDFEFDALENELRGIDPTNEWFKLAVNDKTPKKRKFKLPYPMMSLDKVKTIDALLEWIGKYPDATFVITPKYDGLSVGLNNKMSWTRGDGIIGQNCSEHLNYTEKPYLIETQNVVIRGEIIFTNDNWHKFKDLHPEAVSSRNSATGLINGDFDVNRVEDYSLLSIMAYEIFDSTMPKNVQLNYLGNNVYEKVNAQQINDEFLLNLYTKWKNQYPIDGLVIDVNEPIYRNGTEANGNPSYTIAYKSPQFSETAIAIIKDIELNVNRYGIVTPVAILETPIFLSGAQITRVSAINMNYVTMWGLVPGEKITIVRSGEVIPKIIGVGSVVIPFREVYNKVGDYLRDYNEYSTKRLFEMKETNVSLPDNLTVCPHCGTKLKELINDDGSWCEMCCPNQTCQGRIMEGVIKFFTIAQIDGFGERKITQISSLFPNCAIPQYFQILNVTKEELLSLDGWAETSASSFIAECNKIKTSLPFARFLHATGWFGELGEKTIQKILDLDGWNMDIENLVLIEGVQEKTANTFLSGKINYNYYLETIKDIFTFSYVKTSDIVKEGKLSGLNVCMTGFRDKMLTSQICQLGGNVLDTLTKNVNCLITKDKNSTSSKINKASKMNIEVLDINQFKTKYL